MAKKRLANSEVVRDLHREYTDGPDEIRVSVTVVMLNNMRLVNSGTQYRRNITTNAEHFLWQ